MTHPSGGDAGAECVLAGHWIIQTRPRPDWARTQLPERIVSRSRCLVDEVGDVWMDAWAKRDGDLTGVYRQAKEKFGLTESAVDELCRWYEHADDVDFDVFQTKTAAKRIVDGYLSARPHVAILGLGLPRRHVEAYLATAPPVPDGPAPGTVVDPTAKVLSRGDSLEQGGSELGFEPLVAEYGLGCSWLCNGIDRDAADKLGIQTNANGLLDSLHDAERVVAYINEEGRGEPGVWLPWLLVRY